MFRKLNLACTLKDISRIFLVLLAFNLSLIPPKVILAHSGTEESDAAAAADFAADFDSEAEASSDADSDADEAAYDAAEPDADAAAESDADAAADFDANFDADEAADFAADVAADADASENGSRDGDEAAKADASENGSRDGDEAAKADASENGSQDGNIAGALDGTNDADTDYEQSRKEEGETLAQNEQSEYTANKEKEQRDIAEKQTQTEKNNSETTCQPASLITGEKRLFEIDQVFIKGSLTFSMSRKYQSFNTASGELGKSWFNSTSSRFVFGENRHFAFTPNDQLPEVDHLTNSSLSKDSFSRVLVKVSDNHFFYPIVLGKDNNYDDEDYQLYYDYHYSEFYKDYYNKHYSDYYSESYNNYYKDYYDKSYEEKYNNYYNDYYYTDYENYYDEHYYNYYDEHYDKHYDRHYNDAYAHIYNDIYNDIYNNSYASVYENYYNEYLSEAYDNAYYNAYDSRYKELDDLGEGPIFPDWYGPWLDSARAEFELAETVSVANNGRNRYNLLDGYSSPAGYQVIWYIAPDGFEGLLKVDAEADLSSTEVLAEGITNYYPNGSKLTPFTPSQEIYFLNADGTITVTSKNQEKKHYDIYGRLKSMDNLSGDEMHFEYLEVAGDDLLSRIIDENGRELALFTYNKVGQMISIESLEGRENKYTYQSGMLVSHIGPTERMTKYVYDDKGFLVSRTLPNGGIEKYLYALDEETGKYIYVKYEDELGNSIEHEYDFANRVTKVIDRNGNASVYTYDEKSRITSSTFCNCGTEDERLVYKGENPRPTEVIDGNKNQTLFEYSVEGDLLSVTYADGSSSFFTYNAKRQATSITDPEGHKTMLVYSPKGQLESVLYPDDSRVNYVYDASGRLRTMENQRGFLTEHTYDQYGFLSSIAYPDGSVERFRYNGVGELLVFIDGVGAETKFTYNNAGEITSIVDPLGNVTYFTLDSMGNVTRVLDRLGIKTEYVFDLRSRIAKVVNPVGEEFSYQYDADENLVGTLLKGTKGVQISKRFDYDLKDQPIESTDIATGASTTTEYDNQGNTAKVINTLGYVTEMSYDSRNFLTSVVDSLGQVTGYVYDKRGLLRSVTDKRGNDTEYVYDSMNRVIETINASGERESFSYDAAGNLVTRVDRNGNVTRYTYDSRNRLASSIDAEGAQVIRVYDLSGRVVSVTDARGYTTEYEYNLRGDLISSLDPKGFYEYFEYDVEGRLVSRTDKAGAITRYEYDGVDRVVEVINAEGHSTKFGYHPLGQVSSITDAKGNLTQFDFDSLGRLTNVTDALGHEERFVYDLAGNLLKRYDANNNKESRQYDEINRLVKVVNALGQETEYSYDAENNLTRVLDANQNTYTYAYDPVNRLVAEVNQAGIKQSYLYDPNGNLIEQTDFKNQVTSYRYDKANRLLQVGLPDGDEKMYEYDLAGNLIYVANEASVQKYQFDERNQLGSVSYRFSDKRKEHFIDYSYDANGNRVHRQIEIAGKLVSEFDYFYDSLNRLIEIIDTGEGKTTMVYDELDRLVRQVNPNDTFSTYSYNELGQIQHIRHKSGKHPSLWDEEHPSVKKSLHDRSTLKDDPRFHKFKTLKAYAYDYDPNGNRISEVTARGHVTTYTYDALNRVQSVQYPFGSFSSRPFSAFFERVELGLNENAMDQKVDPDAIKVIPDDQLIPHPGDFDYVEPEFDLEKFIFTNLRPEVETELCITKYPFIEIDIKESVKIPEAFMTEADSKGKRDLRMEYYEKLYEDFIQAYELINVLDEKVQVTRSFMYAAKKLVDDEAEGVNKDPSLFSDFYANLEMYARMIEQSSVDVDRAFLVFKSFVESSELLIMQHSKSKFDRGVRLALQVIKDYLKGLDSFNVVMFVYEKALAKYEAELAYYKTKKKKFEEKLKAYQKAYAEYHAQLEAYETQQKEINEYSPYKEFLKDVQYSKWWKDKWMNRDAEVKSLPSFLKHRLHKNLAIGYFGKMEHIHGLSHDLNDEKRNFDRVVFDLERGVDALPFYSFLDLDVDKKQALVEGYVAISGESANTAAFEKGLNEQRVWKEVYEYDGLHNITARRDGWGSIQYEYNAQNQLTKAGNKTYGYDLNGNLVQGIAGQFKQEYAYSGDNRLRQVKDNGAAFHKRYANQKYKGELYSYDALGRKISEQKIVNIGGVEKRLKGGYDQNTLYDGFGFERATTITGANNNPFLHDFTYANGVMLSYNQANIKKGKLERYVQHKDPLGSVVYVTDSDGFKHQSYAYSAYGSSLKPTWVQNNIVYGYNGKKFSSTSSIYDYGFRHYSPLASRFVTIDPIRFGKNWYGYVLGNPINYVDKDGLIPFNLVTGFVGAVGGAIGGAAAAGLSGGNLNQIALSALAGGVIGATSGFTTAGLGTVAAVGAVGGVVNELINNPDASVTDLIVSGAVGAVTGAALGGFTKALPEEAIPGNVLSGVGGAIANEELKPAVKKLCDK